MYWWKKFKRNDMRKLVIERIEAIQSELYAIHQDVLTDTLDTDYSVLDNDLLLTILTCWERTKQNSTLLLAAREHRTIDVRQLVNIVASKEIEAEKAKRKGKLWNFL